MTGNPLVAIVVLNYNGAKCLPFALASLDRLEYLEKKVIVVDNGSTDGSYERAKEYFPQGIFLQNDTNLGFAAGMNVGILEALSLDAQFIWLFNNDATAEPLALSFLVRFCERFPEVGAVSPIILDENGEAWFSSGKVSFLRMRAVHEGGSPAATPYESEYLTGCALFLPCSTFRLTGLLDERYFLYYEDVDLSLRISGVGRKLFVIPSAKVRHAERSKTDNPEKVYHLVLSGLLFFHIHTPRLLRSWIFLYEFLRRLKNRTDILFHRRGAEMIRRAYQDYDQRYRTK